MDNGSSYSSHNNNNINNEYIYADDGCIAE